MGHFMGQPGDNLGTTKKIELELKRLYSTDMEKGDFAREFCAGM